MRGFSLFVLLTLADLIHASDFSGTWIGTWDHRGESQGVCLYLEQGESLKGRIAYRHDTRVLPIESKLPLEDVVEFGIVDTDLGNLTLRLRASQSDFIETVLVGTASKVGQAASIRLEKYSVPRIYYQYGKGRREPVAIRTSRPEYTPQARAAKLEGTVSLLVPIESSGTVGPGVQVLQGLGLGLDEEAVQCVRKWRFSPPQYDCNPKPIPVRIEVRFVLLP
jgi:TonB family protein